MGLIEYKTRLADWLGLRSWPIRNFIINHFGIVLLCMITKHSKGKV